MDTQPKLHLKNFFLYIGIIILVIIAAVYVFSQSSAPAKEETQDMKKTDATASAQTKGKTYSAAPQMTIDPKKKYSATMTTNKGDIQIEFFADEAPNTVNNFVFLAKDGFYDGVIFHRIVKGFMIQGGDPSGNGTGGPGYKFNDEKVTRDYKRGTLAMANAGPNTNGSQFFIMHQDYALPKNYTIFGQVTQGMDVVDKIAETPTVDSGSGEKSSPTEKIVIEKVTIQEQ